MLSYTLKQIKRAYSKKLKKINNINIQAGLVFFIECLKYSRDKLILKSDTDFSKQTILTSLIAALAEFEAYSSTQNKKQKIFHWNNFCELLKLNMEDWLNL